MDLTQPLIEQRRADTFGPEPDRCLDCGSPPAGSRPIELSLYPGRWLRRCKRCGVRYALDHTGVWRLFHCLGCGLPLLTDDVSSGAARRCGDCRSASNGATPTDGDVARATEREVRAALRAEWRFVGAPTLTAYLDRLTRQLEPPSGRQPSGVRVEVFDQPRVWTLALPSGTVLLSRGALESVEDEAELVFVLAHELSHSAEPGAARRLARLGLREVAAGESDGSPGVWARAAVDLIRVGHGRELEFAADAAGFAAAARLGYDLGAVRRYLDRLGTRQETGDAAVAELVLAHPPVASRLRRLDAFVANRPPERRRVTRTNREVFRRVAGVQVLATRLAPVEGLGERRTARQSVPERANERGVRPWLVLAALLVALAAIVGWYWW